MSGISADDANFLAAGEKRLCHDVSSVAACSENNVHGNLLIKGLDAAERVFDPAQRTRDGKRGSREQIAELAGA